MGASKTASKTGLFYEDFIVGSSFTTRAHTIDETDVATFAKLSADRNPIHTGGNQMESHPLKKPVVHGMLVASIGVGLISELGLTHKTLVAMLEQKIQYKSPVYVGDTIHGKMEVIDKRETSNPKRGIIIYRFEIVSAAGKTVVEGQNKNMVFSKSTQQ